MKRIFTAIWADPTGKIGIFMSLLGLLGSLFANELLKGEIVVIVAMIFLFINMFGVSMIVKIVNRVQAEKVQHIEKVQRKKKH